MVEFTTNIFDIKLISGILTPFHYTNFNVKVLGNFLNQDFIWNFLKGRFTAYGTSIGGKELQEGPTVCM